MLKYLLATVIPLLLACPLLAQWNYVPDECENATRKYRSINKDGVAITHNFNGQPLDVDNDNSAIQQIGFDFPFNGQVFNTFVLNTNGFIKLGSLSPSSVSIAYTQAAGVGHSAITIKDSNLLYPFNRNMIATPETYYKVLTTGKPGERICTIEFANLADNVTPAQFTRINFQIRLQELTGIIEFIYGEWSPSAEPSALTVAAVGIKGNATAQSVNVMKGSGTEWDHAMGMDNAKPYSFIQGNYNVKGPNFGVRNTALPDPGRTYRFIPLKH